MIIKAGIKLRHLRELKNFTQEYMALNLRISIRAYSKIESGETQLTINRLNEISKVLDIDPIEALKFDCNKIFEFTNGSVEGNSKETPDKDKPSIEKYIKHLEQEIIFLQSKMK